MEHALIASMIAPLMKEPDRRSELEDEGLCGMAAEILGSSGSWKRIRMEYRYEGWVHESCLCTDARLVEEWASLPKNIVVQAYADVLDRPRAAYTRQLLEDVPKFSATMTGASDV